jgi:hypothetical protein
MYSLSIEREGQKAPHPIFIVRKVVNIQQEAA